MSFIKLIDGKYINEVILQFNDISIHRIIDHCETITFLVPLNSIIIEFKFEIKINHFFKKNYIPNLKNKANKFIFKLSIINHLRFILKSNQLIFKTS